MFSKGINNNIFGTLNCAQAAINSNIETFVLISSDKAVRPTNTMGAAKRIAELVLQALSEKNHSTGTMRNMKKQVNGFGLKCVKYSVICRLILVLL